MTVLTNPAGQTCTVTNGSGTVGSANVTNVAVTCVSYYSVGGTVSGLSGSLVLQDNSGDNLAVTANGSFTFPTKLAAGAAYTVTVLTNPAGQTCTVSNGSGTVGAANVTNVAVTCVSYYSVGGTVSGLSGSLVLQDNSGDNLAVTANGSFTFPTKLAAGAAYTVTVLTNPAGQTCTVTNGSGTVGSADVTNVAVACTTVSAGPVSDDFNRADGSLGSAWTDMSDGGLAISSQMVTGTNASYSGDIRTGESYTADQYSQIEVTSTQLSGGQWVGPGVRAQSGGQNLYLGIYFWNNGNPQLRLYKRLGGNWTQLGASFSTGPLAAGSQLRLTAVGSTLAFSLNGTVAITATDTDLNSGNPAIMAYGTPLAANWTGASVTGGPGVYTIGGTMSSLTGSVVLQDNGGDNLAVSANGSFTFPTPLVAGGAYTVTVLSNPAGQTCTVSNGSGPSVPPTSPTSPWPVPMVRGTPPAGPCPA